MCTSPIIIYNPTKVHLPYDAVQLEIGCTECADCLSHRQNDWRTRIFAEMISRQKQNYVQGFCTLTYKDECLPHYRDDNHDLPCFSRDDITEFTTNLRRHLHRKFGATDLSFFIASEYGSNTHRPHYHMYIAAPILLSKNKKDEKQVLLDSYELHKTICDYWSKFGFIFPRKHSGGPDKKGYDHAPFQLQDIIASGMYVSKYATKDMLYHSLSEVQQLKAYYKQEPDHPLAQKFKRSLPFIRVSKGFGKSLLDDVQTVDDLVNGVDQLGRPKKVRIPDYIARKKTHEIHYIKYDEDGEKLDKPKVRYRLNAFGKEVKAARLRSNVNTITTLFNSHLFGTGRYSFAEYLGLDISDFDNMINDLLPEKDARVLAIYRLVYHNRVDMFTMYWPRKVRGTYTARYAPPCNLNAFDVWPLESDRQDLIDHYIEFATQHDDFLKQNIKYGLIDSHEIGGLCRFNSFPAFKGFASLLRQLSKYLAMFTRIQKEAELKENKRLTHFKKVHLQTF